MKLTPAERLEEEKKYRNLASCGNGACVFVDGVEYPSILAASIELGCGYLWLRKNVMENLEAFFEGHHITMPVSQSYITESRHHAKYYEIYCIEEDLVFEDLADCAAYYDVNVSTIRHFLVDKEYEKKTKIRSLKGKHLFWIEREDGQNDYKNTNDVRDAEGAYE